MLDTNPRTDRRGRKFQESLKFEGRRLKDLTV
jgi:hypothetical protein